MMKFDQEQKAILNRIVSSDCNNIRVLAGPGTGKTRLMVQAASDVIDSSVCPSRIRLVSFSRRQAEEMRARIDEEFEELGVLYDTPWCGTCHSLAYEIVTAHAVELGIRLPLAVYPNPEEDRCNENPFRAGWKEANKAKATEKFLRNMEAIGAITYDALIERAIDCMKQEKNRKRWEIDVLLVDEIQDFGEKEAEFLRLFSTRIAVWVGDRNQSIYGWRGSSKALLDMEVCAEYEMKTNYRAAKTLVDAANRFSGSEQIAGFGETQGVLGIYEENNIETEAKTIAEWASQSIRGSIAVLTRTNAYANRMRRALRGHGIDCRGDELSLANEVWFRRFMSALRLAVNTSLNFEADAVYNATEAEKAMALGRRIYLYDAIMSSRKDAAAMLNVRQDQGVCTHVFDILDVARDNDPSNNRIYDDRKIAQLLRESNASDAKEFLRYLEETIRDGAVWPEPCKVLVAPVHQAKGMEFDSVAIAGCVDGQFPARWPGLDIDEERNIFYVAITRSRKYLQITVPKKIQITLGSCELMVTEDASPFIKEIE